RLRRIRWHRLAGRVLAPFGIIAAFSGTLMAWRWPPQRYDSVLLNVIRSGVAVAMIAFILVSLTAVRRRDYVAHGRWMTPAYALGAAGGTQFFMFIPFLACESIHSVTAHTLAMSAGWVINIAVAEWSLRSADVPGQATPQLS